MENVIHFLEERLKFLEVNIAQIRDNQVRTLDRLIEYRAEEQKLNTTYKETVDAIAKLSGRSSLDSADSCNVEGKQRGQ